MTNVESDNFPLIAAAAAVTAPPNEGMNGLDSLAGSG